MPKGQENIRRQFRALAGPIFVETFLVMLLGAIDILMLSQYSDDKVASAGMANQLLSMVFLIYAVTSIGTSVCCSGNLLRAMDLDTSLLPDAVDYMQIVGGFSFLQAVSMTLSAFLRAANKAYYPMFVTLLINIMNIFGNYALIFGKFGLPEMGVAAYPWQYCWR